MQGNTRIHPIFDGIAYAYLVSTDDGLTLIDTLTRSNGRYVLRALKKLGHTPADVRQIYITHCDGDHVGGVARLKALSGAMVYAHPIEAAAMARGVQSREISASTLLGRIYKAFGFLFRFLPSQADSLLDSPATTALPGGFTAVPTPGHTPGHTSYYLEELEALFCGDSLFMDKRHIAPSRGANTWNQTKADTSARAQMRLGAKAIYAGHKYVTDISASIFKV
jgi:glyoxylase-like metal-dependent hydrolase (beta-lactamase superfamily II)